MTKGFDGFLANLSTGQTVPEGPIAPGERSAWRQLLDWLKESGEKITGLRLTKNGITIHALPPKQCDGYYHAYELQRLLFKGTYRNLQGIGSVVDDKVFIAWIEESTGNIYLDVRTLEDSKIHTTLG